MSVKLESSDEQVFEVPREIAEMSVTVKHMLDDVDADSDAPIPLPNVTGKILAKVHRCPGLGALNDSVHSRIVSSFLLQTL
jgi:hypothetical protein